MSCAEALRRCPQAVFVRPRHAVYRRTRQRSGRRCARSCQPWSAPASTRATSGSTTSLATSSDARRVAGAVQAAVRGSTGLTCSLGVASCKVVAKVASDARKPGGLTVVPPGPRGRVPRAVRGAQAARRRAEGGDPARARRHRDGRAARGARRRRPAPPPPRQGRAPLRDRGRGIDPRLLEIIHRAHVRQQRGDVRPRHRRPRGAPRRTAPRQLINHRKSGCQVRIASRSISVRVVPRYSICERGMIGMPSSNASVSLRPWVSTIPTTTSHPSACFSRAASSIAYVSPTPGDIPKKIFSLPRVDFASSRFICVRISSGLGFSGSLTAKSLRARCNLCQSPKPKRRSLFNPELRYQETFRAFRQSQFAVTAAFIPNTCRGQRRFVFSKIANL